MRTPTRAATSSTPPSTTIGGGCAGPNVRELRYVQRRLSPSEVAALIADHEAGGWVGELAKLYGLTAPRSLPRSLGPEDLRPDRFLSRARAVCITEAFSALGSGVCPDRAI
jgi:hypothetical protein